MYLPLEFVMGLVTFVAFACFSFGGWHAERRWRHCGDSKFRNRLVSNDRVYFVQHEPLSTDLDPKGHHD